MLYEYLTENYLPNEPILMSDIDLPVTDNNLRQMFKVLCDSGKIKRFDNGVYYIPRQSRLKDAVPFTSEKVAQCKYITRGGEIEGYYSGYTFANQMGLTKQVPAILEIVSNHASAASREVNVKDQRILLRRPKARITTENYRVLQLLDLLKDVSAYIDDEVLDAPQRITDYVKRENIKGEMIDQYICLYPDRIYRNLYEMKLFSAFA